MGCTELKNAESAKETCTEADEAVLRIIHESGLKNHQQISENDLCTVIKALYLDNHVCSISHFLKFVRSILKM